MTTQAKLDAAFAAVTPVVNAKIKNEEAAIPIFVRHTVEEQIAAHRTEIDAFLMHVLDIGIDAADKVDD